ncbi:WD repeat-containing protein slp1 [Smittium culicis]|uniref:WD repeat-containing protein slp1 n=1 Tax=Smittium culicis TaxID=133412 RepID=A0A1R1XQD8_9FUNG|nr:WD repeat-containing protein slp1 [Smittium culicis]
MISYSDTPSPQPNSSTPLNSSPATTRKTPLSQISSSKGCDYSSPIPQNSSQAKFDRFIPNRDSSTLAAGQFNLSQKDSPLILDSNLSEYQSEVAKACGLTLNSRILTFGAEAPVSDKEDYSKFINRNPSSKISASSKLSNKRRILTTPERILDAPGLVDDYYLNLLHWSADNLLAIGLDNLVYLWDANSGEVSNLCEFTNTSPSTIPTHENITTAVQFTSDGSYLAVASQNGQVSIFDPIAQKKIRTMSDRQSRVGALSWNNHIVSAGARDGSIWHHDVRVAKHKVAELFAHTGDICGLKWRSDGALLASGGNDNLVNIWDIRSSVPKFTKTNHTAAVKAIDWCPWQLNLLATGGGTTDKHIHFWNTTTTARVNSINTNNQVTSLNWSTNYREIMSTHGFPNNSISVYSYPALTPISTITNAHDSRILHSAISPDNQVVATVASDENLKFWRIFDTSSLAASQKGDIKSSATTSTQNSASSMSTPINSSDKNPSSISLSRSRQSMIR